MLTKIKKAIKEPEKIIPYIFNFTKVLTTSKIEEILIIDKEELNTKKKLVICFGFIPWKYSHMKEFFPDYCLGFVQENIPLFKIKKILKGLGRPYEVFIWSYKEPIPIYRFLKDNNILIHRIEDGFIRSVGLGSDKAKPLSLVFDNDSLYFNPKTESKLEKIIFQNTKNYTQEQLYEARQLINQIVEKKISKYNFIETGDINLEAIIDKSKKTILVIGQVEDDMSIKLGYDGEIDNLQLVKLAYDENPDCNIIFKSHPDIFKGNRNNKTSVNDYKKYSEIAPNNASLHNLIDISEHIYTITSLSGFEALIRGKEVTCLGAPFYSNWGLTDDRQKVERRQGFKLSLEHLFYAAYIEYPNYLFNNLALTIKNIDQEMKVEND